MTTHWFPLLLFLVGLLATPTLFANSNDQWGTDPLGPVTPPQFTGPAEMKRKAPQFHQKFPTSEPGVTLAENGEAQAVIVIPEKASSVTKKAGELLRDYLKQMTGGDFLLISEAKLTVHEENGRPVSIADPDGKKWAAAIWVGTTEAAAKHGIDPSQLKPGGYRLRSIGNSVFIVGNDRAKIAKDNAQGTYFGACALLEEQLGVRWLWPGSLGTVIPQRKSVVLPALHEQDEPAIAQRLIRPLNNIEPRQQAGLKRLGGSEEENTELYRQTGKNRAAWCSHNRLGSSLRMRYGHTYSGWYKNYASEHPEWFALQSNGSREQKSDRPRLCKGNPEVAKQAALQVLAEYKANPLIDAAAISPNDGSAADNFCLCAICRKLDPPNGNPVQIMITEGTKRRFVTYPAITDRVATFYNRIAEEVVKTNPDAKMGAYAYHIYRDVPLGVKMHPSIIVGFVGLNYFGENARETDLTRWNGWSKAANELFLRPNIFHGAEALPGIYAKRLGEDILHCYRTGMMATDFDSLMGHWSTQGINYYVLAKLLWNPGADPEAILQDYCESGFGKAAPKVREYLNALEEATLQVALLDKPAVEKDRRADDDDTPQPVVKGDPLKNRYFSVFTPEKVKALRDILIEAKTLEPDPTVQARITFLECGLDFAELSRAVHESDKKEKAPRADLIAWYREMFQKQPEAINQVYLLWKTGATFRGVD